MRFGLHRFAVMLLAAAAAACASAGAGAPAPASSRSVITETELAASGSETAYDAIQRLRPEFLRARPSASSLGSGAITAPPAALVVGGQRVGELADLRHIPAISLSQIRYYNVEEAKRSFGMQYAGGALELTYRTR